MVMLSYWDGSWSRALLVGWVSGAIWASTTGSSRAQDCNGNGVADAGDIAQGTSMDCGRDGIPDECQDGFSGRKSNLLRSVPLAFISADFDEDGRLDIATANDGSYDISVLLGNGDGTFRTHLHFGQFVGPRSLAADDFDEDGHVDIAAGGYAFLGKGDGSFDFGRNFTRGIPDEVVVSDLDANGHADIVTEAGSVVTTFVGNGDGSFQAGRTVPSVGIFLEDLIPYLLTGDGPSSLVASDLDEDGRIDLATANAISNNVSMIPGNGDGTFMAPLTFEVGARPGSLVAVDLDGDGRKDFATANWGLDISILLGSGGRAFEVERRFAAGADVSAMAAADLDGDGRTDLVTAQADSRTVATFMNAFPPADLTPPVLRCPGDILVQCVGDLGAPVDFLVTAEDDCDPRPMVVCDFPPGTVFPPGTTLVTCSVLDASENRAECRLEVEVACPGQVPGDCDQDGNLNISDGICVLNYLFVGMPAALPCGDGASSHAANQALLDWTGDGLVDLSDGVSSLLWLFLGAREHALGAECRPLDGCPEVCI